MNNDIELDMLLRGRKFKRMIENVYKDIREKYSLKQVEVEVLLYLGQMPDLSSTDLAKELSLQKGHISVAMFSLCKKGFLQSEQSQEDRRYVHFRITDEGQKVKEEIERIKDSINHKILEGFSEEDICILRTLCCKILKNVEKLPE